MEERKPKGHKNFYIGLNHPSGFIFTDEDIVSGKCVLLSAHDEDVGSVTVLFRGTIKASADTRNYKQNTKVPMPIIHLRRFIFRIKDSLPRHIHATQEYPV